MRVEEREEAEAEDGEGPADVVLGTVLVEEYDADTSDDGEEGDGEGDMALMGAAEGRIGGRVVAFGEIGASRRSGGGRWTIVAFEDGIASKAWTLALTAEDAIAA